MMKKMLALSLAVLLLGAPMTGCTKQTDDTAQETSSTVQQSMTAQPEKAMDEIYKDIDMKELQTADDAQMEALGFDLWKVEEYYARTSSGRYGVADVFIIKPYPDDYDAVREVLENMKADRIQKTESYDILDSHKIAQNAVIFQYGSYLIMLMLADNAAATEIIQTYIPSTEMAIVQANGN